MGYVHKKKYDFRLNLNYLARNVKSHISGGKSHTYAKSIFRIQLRDPQFFKIVVIFNIPLAEIKTKSALAPRFEDLPTVVVKGNKE